MAKPPRRVTEEQAKALAELYVWAAVIEILEGGTAPRIDSGHLAATAVVKIAKTEQQKLLRKYDSEARNVR